MRRKSDSKSNDARMVGLSEALDPFEPDIQFSVFRFDHFNLLETQGTHRLYLAAF